MSQISKNGRSVCSSAAFLAISWCREEAGKLAYSALGLVELIHCYVADNSIWVYTLVPDVIANNSAAVFYIVNIFVKDVVYGRKGSFSFKAFDWLARAGQCASVLKNTFLDNGFGHVLLNPML